MVYLAKDTQNRQDDGDYLLFFTKHLGKVGGSHK